MEVDFALVAQNLKKRPNNVWDITGFTYAFGVPSFPATLPPFIVFISCILTKPDENTISTIGVQIRDPDERSLSVPLQMELVSEDVIPDFVRVNLDANPGQVSVRAPGTYTVRIYVDGKAVYDARFLVIQSGQ